MKTHFNIFFLLSFILLLNQQPSWTADTPRTSPRSFSRKSSPKSPKSPSVKDLERRLGSFEKQLKKKVSSKKAAKPKTLPKRSKREPAYQENSGFDDDTSSYHSYDDYDSESARTGRYSPRLRSAVYSDDDGYPDEGGDYSYRSAATDEQHYEPASMRAPAQKSETDETSGNLTKKAEKLAKAKRRRNYAIAGATAGGLAISGLTAGLVATNMMQNNNNNALASDLAATNAALAAGDATLTTGLTALNTTLGTSKLTEAEKQSTLIELLRQRALQTTVTTELDKKAEKNVVDALATTVGNNPDGTANDTGIFAALNTKASTTDMQTNVTNLQTNINAKADTTALTALATTVGTDAAGTANDTGIFAALNTKASTTDLSATNAAINTQANEVDVLQKTVGVGIALTAAEEAASLSTRLGNLTTTVGTDAAGTANDTGIFSALNTKASTTDLSELRTTVGAKANTADLATLRTSTGFAADGTTRLATGLAGDLSRLTTTIGDASSGLVRNVNNIQSSDSAQAATLLGLSGEIHDQTRGLGATYALASTTAGAVNDARTGLASRASAADLSNLSNTVNNSATGLGATYALASRTAEAVNDADTGLASRASATDLASKANASNVYSIKDADDAFASKNDLTAQSTQINGLKEQVGEFDTETGTGSGLMGTVYNRERGVENLAYRTTALRDDLTNVSDVATRADAALGTYDAGTAKYTGTGLVSTANDAQWKASRADAALGTYDTETAKYTGTGLVSTADDAQQKASRADAALGTYDAGTAKYTGTGLVSTAAGQTTQISDLRNQVGSYDTEANVGTGLMGDVYNSNTGLAATSMRAGQAKQKADTAYELADQTGNNLGSLANTVAGKADRSFVGQDRPGPGATDIDRQIYAASLAGRIGDESSGVIGNVRNIQNVVDQHSTALTDASSRFATREFVGEGMDANDGRFIGTVAGRLNTYRTDSEATNRRVSDLSAQVGTEGNADTRPTGIYGAIAQKADASNVYTKDEIGSYDHMTGTGTGKFTGVAQTLIGHQQEINDLSSFTRGTFSVQDGRGVFSGGLAGRVDNLETSVGSDNEDPELARGLFQKARSAQDTANRAYMYADSAFHNAASTEDGLVSVAQQTASTLPSNRTFRPAPVPISLPIPTTRSESFTIFPSTPTPE